MSTTNTETTPENTQDATQDSPEPPGRAETPEATPKPGEGHTAPEPVEGDDVSKLRKEAAGHRVSAKEAREELDSTRERLSVVQDALLSAELKSRGTQLTPAALAAVGLRDGVFSEDSGTVDGQALDVALEQAQTLGLTVRKRPAPDLTTGREVPPGGEITAPGWSQVFKK